MNYLAEKTTFLLKIMVLSLTICIFMSGIDNLRAEDDKAQSQEQKTKKDIESQSSTTPENIVEAQGELEKGVESLDAIRQALQGLREDIEADRELTSSNELSVKTVAKGIDLVDSKLKETYNHLDKAQVAINQNTTQLVEVEKLLGDFSQKIKSNDASIRSQNMLIEDNSIRLYELLITINRILSQIEEVEKKASISLDDSKNSSNSIEGSEKIFLGLLALLSPLAFMGWLGNRRKVDTGKVWISVALTTVSFFVLGFGFLFGSSLSGWVGVGSLAIDSEFIVNNKALSTPVYEIYFISLGYIVLGTTLTLFFLARCLSFSRSIILSLLLGAVILPVFGHWVTASSFVHNNKGWLEGAGLVDYGNTLLVSLIPSVFSLLILSRLKPKNSSLLRVEQDVYGAWILLIAFIALLLGQLPLDDTPIFLVLMNSTIAMAAGGLGFALHQQIFSKQIDITNGLMFGSISGVVAIIACAPLLKPLEAALLGIVVGIFSNTFVLTLKKLKLPNSTLQLASSHIIGSIGGVVAVAALGTEGLFSMVDTILLMTQLQSIAAALGYSFIFAYLVFTLLNAKTD